MGCIEILEKGIQMAGHNCLIETWDVLKSLHESRVKLREQFNRNMGCIEIFKQALFSIWLIRV